MSGARAAVATAAALPALLLQGCYYCYPDRCEKTTPAPPSTAVAIFAEHAWTGSNTACLTLADNRELKGTLLHAFECDKHKPTASQIWHFHNGQISHSTSQGANLCLDIPNNDQRSGKRLQVWECCAECPQQQFMFSAKYRAIMTTDHSFCLDLRREDNHSMQLWKCNFGQANQKWDLAPLAAEVALV